MEEHSHKLSQQIEWTNLAVKFQTHIDKLTYILEEQNRVANETHEQKLLWAMQAMSRSRITALPKKARWLWPTS